MSPGKLVPVGLRCAHKVSPLGVEPDRVRFSWKFEASGPEAFQTAYQVIVTSEAKGLEDPAGSQRAVWDSGRVSSSDSTDAPYLGTPLTLAGRYHWRVRAWDGLGEAGAWSDESTFETGLGPAPAWRARWIGAPAHITPMDPPTGDGPVDAARLAMLPPTYLRRAFDLGSAPSRGRLYVTALGVYDLRLNGHRVSDSVLAPGWTDYDQRCLYQTYDVTSLLVEGENVMGAIVADGWACSFYGFDAKRAGAHYATSPQLLAVLVVESASGERFELGTDELWEASTGGVLYADLLMGEGRDPALEQIGWDSPGYDSTGWRRAGSRAIGDRALVADPGPPIRVTEELPAKAVSSAPGGVWVVDFGQNLAGWVRVVATPPTGTAVHVRHSEVLTPEGRLYVDNLRTARQVDSYVAVGGEQCFEPRFTFHGFRYIEVAGLPTEPSPSSITALVVHSDTPLTGSFECSSVMVNKLFSNIDWGQRGNFISVPTDCPQRDERLGWLGDAQIFVRTAAYNRDVAAFFSKWMDDVTDSQLADGAFTDFAPSLGRDWASAPAWGDAGVIVPWTIYKMYGDKAILERCLGAMQAWLAFLERTNPDGLRVNALGNNYGDWLAPVGDMTPRELLATAYWAYDAAIMSEIASVLGYETLATEYREMAAKVEAAFQKAFLNPGGRVVSGTQTAYALSLHIGLVPLEARPAAAANLVSAVEDANWHITTGFVGVGYLLPVLSANGHSHVAYRILEQKTFPSWLYTVAQGATTIWERWDGWTEDKGFQSPRMNSFNHYSLGSVGEWLYRYVLGIEQAPGAAGFERIALRPHPGGSLAYARGHFESVRGRIAGAWRLDGEVFNYQVTVPANVRATVYMPSTAAEDVLSSAGSRPDRVQGYPGLPGTGEAVFEVGPGRYSFSGPRPDIHYP